MSTTLPTFAAVVVHGPAWDNTADIRQQADWDSHAKYMDALVSNGTILLGGPLDDAATILHLVTATNETSARRHLSQDPWHRTGLLRIAHIQRWHLWLDGRT
jgi:uncharacterized protein YciI